MTAQRRIILLAFFFVALAAAQQPFYTDDPGVTEPGQWHFEAFNEFDFLQRPQFPNLRQNTASYKLNYGLSHKLELDIDAPYLAIFRDLATPGGSSHGVGDTNLGVKWNFHEESKKSRLPGMSVSMYFEFPTGDRSQQLGSGLTDYWLNVIWQKHLTEKTRLTGNTGVLFAGNTSVGVLGIETRRGRVYTGGLSLLHEINGKWTVGTEAYLGFSAFDLSKSQIQILTGGKYTIRDGLTFDFGVLTGKYIASPRIGAQIGVSVDFPAVIKPAAAKAP